jgi:hypothetical protein
MNPVIQHRCSARTIFSRRHFLHLGGLAAVAGPWIGLSAAAEAKGDVAIVGKARRARSCILVYLLGGPPHLDTWDLKPQAPAEIRGPFNPISTKIPGLQICEHLPRLAQRADRYTLLRAVSHPNSNHTPMIYYTLTGREVERPEADNDVRSPLRSDYPHIGALAARFCSAPSGLPGFVAMPEVAVRSSADNIRPATPLRGGSAGFLGPSFDPLIVNNDPRDARGIPALMLPDDVPARRFERRQSLLDAVQSRSSHGSSSNYDELRQMAVQITGAAGDASLYSLVQEPPAVRERYGNHRFGQSLLLARRLAEAGVPMIAVHFNHMTRCDGWDTHAKNFEACQTELLPMLDEGLSALIDDLHSRGLLEQTVVACFGEFGRTPRINAAAGRDHWGPCSSALLAGGGVHGGRVIGASDREGAYPHSGKVDPVDLHASIFHCLGIDSRREVRDESGRPFVVSSGQPISELL